MNLLLSTEADEFILLLINTIPMSKFSQFIHNIDQKKNWSEELCCCYFENDNCNNSYYRFETFEGNTYKLSYDDFLEFVRLAIIRFYLGSKEDEMQLSIKDSIANTVFHSCLNDIDDSLALDIPLIG